MKLINTFRNILLGAACALTLVTASAGEMRPAKGRAEGVNTLAVFTANPFNAQGQPIFGLVFRYTESVSEGNATGIGKYTMTSRNYVSLAFVDGAVVAKVTGDWVMTSVSGEQIWGTHEFYRPLSGDLVMTGVTSPTGGTGRFEGAHGESQILGTIYPNAATGLDAFEFEWEGVITSVGSSRGNN